MTDTLALEDCVAAPELIETETPTGVGEGRRPRRRRWPFVVAALLVPVVAFACVYLLFFTPDSPPRLTLSTTADRASGPSADIPLGRWSVGPDSVAGYRVREKLLSLPAPNDGVGRTSAIVGGFTLAKAADAYIVRQGLRIEVDVASLKSDMDRRDDHMRTMGLETDRFPTATFVSAADQAIPADVVAGSGRGRTSIVGDLTIHGVTRRVSVPLDVQLNGGRVEVVGALTFNWDLFAIQAPNLSYVSVESTATLEFQLLFAHTLV